MWTTIVNPAAGRGRTRRLLPAIEERAALVGAKVEVSLTPDDGTHAVQLSPSGRHLIDTYSKPDVPPVVVLRDAESGAVELPLELPIRTNRPC